MYLTNDFQCCVHVLKPYSLVYYTQLSNILFTMYITNITILYTYARMYVSLSDMHACLTYSNVIILYYYYAISCSLIVYIISHYHVYNACKSDRDMITYGSAIRQYAVLALSQN